MEKDKNMDNFNINNKKKSAGANQNGPKKSGRKRKSNASQGPLEVNYFIQENGSIYIRLNKTNPLLCLNRSDEEPAKKVHHADNLVQKPRIGIASNLYTDAQLPSTSAAEPVKEANYEDNLAGIPNLCANNTFTNTQIPSTPVAVKRTLFLHTINPVPPVYPDDYMQRTMNETVAFIKKVRATFFNEQHKIEAFYNVLFEHQLLKINTMTLMTYVAFLFDGHDNLLHEFNRFLPAGLRFHIHYISEEEYIKLKSDLDQQN